MQILTPLLRKTAHSKVSVIKMKKKTLTYVEFLNATIEKDSSIVRNSHPHPLPGNKESVLGSRYIIIMNVIMMGAKKPTRR